MITPLACGSCWSWIAKLSNRAYSSSHFMSPNSSNLLIGFTGADPFTNTTGKSRATRTVNLISRDIDSLNPIRNKNIRLARFRSVAIRSEDELLSVRRKHRKAVERVVIGNPLKTRSVRLDQVEIKIAPLAIRDVRRKDYSFSIRKKVWREAGFVEMRHLSLVRSVRVHHPNLERGRPNQILLE